MLNLRIEWNEFDLDIPDQVRERLETKQLWVLFDYPTEVPLVVGTTVVVTWLPGTDTDLTISKREDFFIPRKSLKVYFVAEKKIEKLSMEVLQELAENGAMQDFNEEPLSLILPTK